MLSTVVLFAGLYSLGGLVSAVLFLATNWPKEPYLNFKLKLLKQSAVVFGLWPLVLALDVRAAVRDARQKAAHTEQLTGKGRRNA